MLETTVPIGQVDAQTKAKSRGREHKCPGDLPILGRVPQSPHVDRGFLDLVTSDKNPAYLARLEPFQLFAHARIYQQTGRCGGELNDDNVCL